MKTLREPRIKDTGTQASFEDIEEHSPFQPSYRDSYTQINENELIPFETRARPVVQDLVHEVLNRAVFAIEQERDLQRITTFKQHYHSLRVEEEQKLSDAKPTFLEVSKEVASHESALRKVHSIRLARRTIDAVIESVLNRPRSIHPITPSRLDELVHSIVPQMVDLAEEIADVMRQVQKARITVGNKEQLNHTNTCVY